MSQHTSCLVYMILDGLAHSWKWTNRCRWRVCEDCCNLIFCSWWSIGVARPIWGWTLHLRWSCWAVVSSQWSMHEIQQNTWTVKDKIICGSPYKRSEDSWCFGQDLTVCWELLNVVAEQMFPSFCVVLCLIPVIEVVLSDFHCNFPNSLGMNPSIYHFPVNA